jgi:hypothetical protein
VSDDLKMLRALGLEPCDELLTCVSAKRCDQCDSDFAVDLLKLKEGQVYRAVARDPRGGGWFIPSLSPVEPCNRCGGKWCGRVSVILWCAPHFGTWDEGEHDEELVAKIKNCKPAHPDDGVRHRDRELEDA